MKCAKCNKENEAEAKFCRYCGASMPAQGPSGQGTLFDFSSTQPAAGNKAAASNDSRKEDVLGWYRYAEIAAVVIVALLITGGVLLAANQVRSRREAASLWAKAWNHSRLGEPDKAALCAQEIMDKYPSTREAASAREGKPKWDIAYAEQQRQARFVAAEKEKQMRIAALVRETESLRDKGQLDEAAASIEQALMLDANHSRARGLQVEVQVLIEQRRVQAEKEKRFADLCTSAAGYAGSGDNEKAVGDYVSALEIKPDDAQIIEKLAQCRHDLYCAKGAKAEKDGDLEAAIDGYKTALTHRQTASTQAAMDSAKQALEKQTQERTRQDFEKLMAKAAAADPNKAAEPLSHALNLYPTDHDAVALRKTVIGKLMSNALANEDIDRTKALTSLAEILKLDPSNNKALALQAKISITSAPSYADSHSVMSAGSSTTTTNGKSGGDSLTRTSYAMGFLTGSGFRNVSFDVKTADYAVGLQDGLWGMTSAMTQEEAAKLLTDFAQELKAHLAQTGTGDYGTTPAAAKPAMQTSDERMTRISYAAGLSAGAGFKRESVGILPLAYINGLKAGLANDTSFMTESEMREVVTGYARELKAKGEGGSAAPSRQGENEYAASQVDESRIRGGIQQPVVRMDEVSEPSKFGLTIDAERIARNLQETQEQKKLKADRLAKLRELYLAEKLTLDQYQLGQRLIDSALDSPNSTDSRKLAEFQAVADGKLPPERLQRALDAIETPEQRAARLARETAEREEMLRRQAEQQRQQAISDLLSVARTNDSKASGKKALDALEEVLKLDPSHSQAQALRKKILGYYGPADFEVRPNSIGMKLVYIPAGSFMMGSNDGGANEKPVRNVTLSKGFWMGQTEVTQGEYQAIMGINPSHFKSSDSLPVENVSWDDAVEFCRKLSQKDGRAYTLPTEAQWEYACRGGTTTKFSFGVSDSSLGSYAWYIGNSGNKTQPVGQKQANAFGLYDMHGNVWEWCLDWYSAYDNNSSVDPQGPQGGTYRVLRGGSWGGSPAYCRSANRNGNTPGVRLIYVGFRVVCLDF